MTDNDTAPPVVSAREDCKQPHGCVCPDSEPCHFDALQRNAPEAEPDE